MLEVALAASPSQRPQLTSDVYALAVQNKETVSTCHGFTVQMCNPASVSCKQVYPVVLYNSLGWTRRELSISEMKTVPNILGSRFVLCSSRSLCASSSSQCRCI